MKKHTLLALGAIAAFGFSPPVLAQDDVVTGGERGSGTQGVPSSRPRIAPYVEASQIGNMQISPGDDVVTYSQIAAGVDVSSTGRNSGGSLSLRYERIIGYGKNSLNGGSLTGVARGNVAVVPRTLTVEAGAIAARTRVDSSGGATFNALNRNTSQASTYSAYAGPRISTEAGPVNIEGNYRAGYTRVEQPNGLVTAPGAQAVEVFDDSISQDAALRIEIPARRVLPVGVGVEGGWNQEDIANYDQRVRDAYVRGDVTVPISSRLEVIGGLSYEDVTVSSRNAVVDGTGAAVIGTDGRVVTDKSQPRQLAYDVSGLIWDVGVGWRPSSRTSLKATVGRRYNSMTYYGDFSWAPDSKNSVNVSVYDAIGGFGSQLNNRLSRLPTDFSANRNLLTGEFNGCVAGNSGTSCLGSSFGSVRSSVARLRGVVAGYQTSYGNFTASVTAGYNHRRFIARQNLALASANGLSDENFYGTFSLDGKIDRYSRFATNVYASLLKSGTNLSGDILAVGASASYLRNLTSRLSARAAVSVDSLDSNIATENSTNASALLGLRYDF